MRRKKSLTSGCVVRFATYFRHCYCATSTTFASMCTAADDRLFTQVTCNTQHLLHDLLPPHPKQHYYLHERLHNYQLADHA